MCSARRLLFHQPLSDHVRECTFAALHEERFQAARRDSRLLGQRDE